MKMRAVVFDAFGTLLTITERRNPYRQLMQWMEANGRTPQPEDAAQIMSQPGGLAETAARFGMEPPADLLAAWQADLHSELQSIQRFPDVLPIITRLKGESYRIGVCSNLAEPYGGSVRTLLPELDAYALSYQVGAVKPESAIYQALITQLGCSADEVLFVGDSQRADFEGPRAFGMNARLIDRNTGQTMNGVLADLISGSNSR